MCKLLRRLFVLALVAGAGCAIYTAVTSRRRPPEGDAPAWPPIDDAPPAPADTAASPAAAVADLGDTGDGGDDGADAADEAAATATQRWAEPVDGQCPDGYPIKGNADSGIYHVPGGRFYERTIPERCYANEDDAMADGYRRSKA